MIMSLKEAEELETLQSFARWVIRNCWTHLDLDTSDIHRKAEELRLVVKNEQNGIYQLAEFLRS